MRITRPLGLVALVALAAVACSDGSSDGDAGSERPSTITPAPIEVAADEDLYALAEDLEPGEPGDVIAVQEVDGLDVDGTVLRVLYHSESLEGDDIAVSGMVGIPDGPAPDGGRPILSWAHGTTGIADECAPSLDPVSNGIALVDPFLERGMVFVATDYEGLGTPGRHPYIAGESEGRSTLDMARAAIALGELTDASNEVVVWGHSQGGHAALFANQIAETWAPELDVLGTVAGAPPSQLPLLAAALKDTPASFLLGMVSAGWEAAYPEADPSLWLTPLGVEQLDEVDEGCTDHVASAWGGYEYDELVKADPASVEPWGSLLIDNDPGYQVGASPVLIIHGEDDPLIPPISSQLLVTRMCEVGQPVERRTFPGEDHGSVVPASMLEMLEWIDAVLAGEAVPSDCDP